MQLKSKKKSIKKVYGSFRKYRRFNKIMFISCSRINLNRYKLTYLMDYVFNSDDCISTFVHSVYIDFEQYNQIIKHKFGVWLYSRFLNKSLFNYYVYFDNGKLIYKSTKHDNGLSLGEYNSYNHKLIYKAMINDKLIIER